MVCESLRYGISGNASLENIFHNSTCEKTGVLLTIPFAILLRVESYSLIYLRVHLCLCVPFRVFISQSACFVHLFKVATGAIMYQQCYTVQYLCVDMHDPDILIHVAYSADLRQSDTISMQYIITYFLL